MGRIQPGIPGLPLELPPLHLFSSHTLPWGASFTPEISIITSLLIILTHLPPQGALPAARPSNKAHVDTCSELRCFAGLSVMGPTAL